MTLEATFFCRVPIICLSQGAARDLPWSLGRCTRRRDKMRKYQVFCPNSLRHRAEVGGQALTIENLQRHSAIMVRSHNGVDRRMDDHIHVFGESLHLSGG